MCVLISLVISYHITDFFLYIIQRGNPILKFVRSVPWEFGDVVPDYVLGQTTCALFLRWDSVPQNYWALYCVYILEANDACFVFYISSCCLRACVDLLDNV